MLIQYSHFDTCILDVLISNWIRRRSKIGIGTSVYIYIYIYGTNTLKAGAGAVFRPEVDQALSEVPGPRMVVGWLDGRRRRV